MTLTNKRILLSILIVLFFSCMLSRYLQRVPQRHYCDFRVYHHVAKDFLAGKDIYYRDTEAITPFKYSPFFAFVINPIGLLPIKVAAALFFVINFLATIVLFRWAKEIIVQEPLSAKEGFFLYFIGAVFISRYVILNWDSGQVVIIMCALTVCSLYLFSRERDVLGAALLAGAILIKYMPAIFIPYLIFRKKFKAAALTVIFIVLWLLLPALVVGIQKNIAYLTSWFPSIISTSLDSGSYYNPSNQSIFSVVLRSTSSIFYGNSVDFFFRWSMWIACAISFLLYLLVLLSKKGKDTFKIDCALLFIFMALFNPNAWLLDFVSLIFPCLFLTYYLIKVKLKDVFVLVSFILSFVFLFWFSRTLVGYKLQFFAKQISCVAIAAFFLIGALVKLKFSETELGSKGLRRRQNG